ncbi:SDR family oxidoreductase [Rhodococcus sp. WS4]|nr:SDR family oxidoreductase [Rhodococcus sp. WS4]
MSMIRSRQCLIEPPRIRDAARPAGAVFSADHPSSSSCQQLCMTLIAPYDAYQCQELVEISRGDTMFARSIVVVGALNDVGIAVTRSMAGEGVLIAIVDEWADDLSALAEELRALGSRVLEWVVPLHDLEGLRALRARWPSDVSECDALISCQLDTDATGVVDSDMGAWERVVRSNLTGPVVLAQSFVPLMKAAEHPSIVHVGSIDGLFGHPGLASYSVSKGGLLTLTRVMAHELGKDGIRVNYVARCGTAQTRHGRPGPSADELSEDRRSFIDKISALTPLGRVGEPEETASVVRFLCSSAASFISGTTITVDGARTATTVGTS